MGHVFCVATFCLCHRAVGVLQQYITLTLYQQQTLTTGVQAATQLLGMVHEANQVGWFEWIFGVGCGGGVGG